MSTDSSYIKSPKGEIQFLALNNKVTKDMKPDSPEGYAIRVKFNSTTKEGAAFKKAISDINPNLIGTKHTNNKDEYTVRAFSKYFPVVLDSSGNTMEEVPNFYNDSKGTAAIVVTPYTKNEMGGAINLVGIVIHDIEVGENTASNGASEEALNTIRGLLLGSK